MLLVIFAHQPSYVSADEYVMGTDDVLKITVYNHPDMSSTERVTAEGMINLPYVGEIKVAGMTADQAAKKIAARLSDGFIVDPNVSVFVVEFRSRKTIIMGQVNKPGIYMLSGNTTFLELLSLAGGLTRDAGDKATLKRRPEESSKKETVITIDLKRLIEEGETSLDIPIMDGDNIYVGKAGVFYITGEIKSPAAYKFQEGLTMIKVVTMAGGFTDKAAPNRIRIIRKVDNKERVLEKVGMDEPVLPDDIIIVPESYL